MLRFDLDTWKKLPDLYPMVAEVPKSPGLTKPVFKDNTSLDIHHGDVLVSLVDGSWHSLPEDVYRKVRSELYE